MRSAYILTSLMMGDPGLSVLVIHLGYYSAFFQPSVSVFCVYIASCVSKREEEKYRGQMKTEVSMHGDKRLISSSSHYSEDESSG